MAEIEARAAQVRFAAAILGATAPTLPNVLAGTRWADPAVGRRLRAMYDSIAEDTSFASSMAIQVGPGVYRLPPNPTPEQVVFVIQEWANGLPMISPVDLVKLLVTSVIPDPGAVAAGGPGAVIEIVSLIPAGRLADVAKAFERAADAADDVSDAARAVANAAEEMAELADEVADAASAAEDVGDVTDAAEAADALPDANDGPGKWIDKNEGMSEFSADYQEYVAGGVPGGLVYEVNGVAFDGITPEGVLLDAKGRYAGFVDPRTGQWEEWRTGQAEMLREARRQANAAAGTPIRWVFHEPEAAAAAARLLRDEGITGIEVVVDTMPT